MNTTKLIRNSFIKYMKNRRFFDRALIAEIDGCNFAGVDIALPAFNNQCQVYRLVIIKCGQKNHAT